MRNVDPAVVKAALHQVDRKWLIAAVAVSRRSARTHSISLALTAPIALRGSLMLGDSMLELGVMLSHYNLTQALAQ